MPISTESTRRPRTAWLLAAVLLPALIALGNLPLLTGHANPKWDAADLFEPSFALAGDAARAGQLVKWDPWSGAGAPDWTQPEFGLTSPILLAFSFAFTNPSAGYIAYWLCTWVFGGLGMLFLAKHAGCPAPGGFIVACGFAASGFFTGHAEHMSSIYSVSFLPWILWRFDAALLRSDWRCGVEAGLLYGLSALGGYPEFTILTPGFLALWALARVLTGTAEASEPTPRRCAPGLALAVWTACLSIGFLIFSLPYAGLVWGTRGYTDYIGPRARDAAVSSNLLPAGALSTFASPYLANLNLPPHPLWPQTDISMTSVYAGAASLVLAAFALRRIRQRWWLAAIGGFFLCCALGSQLPIRGWLYDLLPPTRYFRNPSLFRAYVILVIGFLAALGARDLHEASALHRLYFRRLAIASACAAAICFAVVLRFADSPAPDLRAGVAHLLLAWFGFAALSLLFKAPRRFLSFAAVLACLDAWGALYLSRPTLWDPPQPWFQQANAAHIGSIDLTSSGLNRDLLPLPAFGQPINNRDLLIKRAVFDDYTSHQIFRNRFQRQILADPLLNRMASGSGRIWFSPSARMLPPSDAAFLLFSRRVHELDGQPVLLLHSPAQMLSLPSESSQPLVSAESDVAGLPACLPAAVTGLNYQPALLSFRYDAPESGYLLVTDRWADGWEATVNGEPRPVLGADFIYRAVQVGAGPNLVRFVYDPALFHPLLALSWGAIFAIAPFLLSPRSAAKGRRKY